MNIDTRGNGSDAPCELEEAVRSIEANPQQLRKDSTEATAMAIRFYLNAKAQAVRLQRKFRVEYETQGGRTVTANVTAVNSTQAWLSVVMHHAEFGEVASRLISVHMTGLASKREVAG